MKEGEGRIGSHQGNPNAAAVGQRVSGPSDSDYDVEETGEQPRGRPLSARPRGNQEHGGRGIAAGLD